MSLQPSNKAPVDRTTTAPFLLRLFYRQSRPLDAHEFSIAPPSDTSDVTDYASLLPAQIRQNSVQIYTWPTCTLAELTGLLGSVLPGQYLEVGTRVVYKLVFPDTRSNVDQMGRGRWVERPLGIVAVGGKDAVDANGETNGDIRDSLEGDAEKTLADARFVIGDYVACAIYPPGQGPVGGGRGPRDMYGMPPRGPPPGRENGGMYGPPRGYRGGGRGGGGYGAPPPPGDWRRGERPPGGGYGGYRGGGRGGGRPY